MATGGASAELATLGYVRASPRQILSVHGPMAAVGVLLVLAVADGRHWERGWLIAGLALLAAAGSMRPLKFGTMSLDAHMPAVVFALGLAGPGPAVLVSLAASVAGDVGRRPWHYVFLNASAALLWSATSGLLVEVAVDSDWVTRGDPSIGLALLPAGLVGIAINYAAVLPATRMEGLDVWVELRATAWPAVPFEVLTVLAGAGCVALYEVTAAAAVAGLVAGTGILVWVLALISRGERRSEELARLTEELVSTSERERRNLAAALHDDALQRLALARQDLAEGMAGDEASARRAHEEIAVAVQSLRALMSDLGTGAPPPPDVAAAVDAVRERTGLEIDVEVDPALAADETVVVCVAELLRNVEKHARARRVSVAVSPAGEIVVSDDGIGTDVDLAAAAASGHLGLALVARRAQERGGHLEIRRRPSGGTAVRVRLAAG